jgi:hypothetical protein
MALKRLAITGYSVLETNKVVFRRDGNIFAQFPLSSDFSASTPAENGMILAVDLAKGEVNLPAGATGEVLALHFSTEKLYNQQHQKLNEFALFPDSSATTEDSNYPRLGVLSIGDTFTTNCIAYLEADFANNAALLAAFDAIATTPLYGIACTNGAIQITSVKPTAGLGLNVMKVYTLPNGDFGVKFGVMHV